MPPGNGQDKNNDDPDLSWLDEEDPFGLNEEIETITFKCLKCRKTDEVPDFVVDEFQYDLNKNEEVEVVCPFCNGTMRRAKDQPEEK